MEAQMKLYQSVLGGREAARPEWTAKGPTEIIEGRTRVDVRRLQAFQGMGMSVSSRCRGIGDGGFVRLSFFLAAHDSYVGTLSDLKDIVLLEGVLTLPSGWRR